MPKIRTILLFLCACSLFYTACEDNNYFTIGNENVQVNTRVVVIDTCTAKLSTLMGDSVVTSNKNIGWIGKHNDSELGLSEASTYFALTYPGSSVEKKARFDSITVIFTPNGNYYGDTTTRQEIELYKLTSVLKYNEDSNQLYNASVVSTDALPFGTVSFLSRPGKQDRIERRLPDEFGKTLLSLFTSQASEVETADKFERYFKGLALKPTATSNCMMAYNLADTNFVVKIYYNILTDKKESKTLEFRAAADKQFYHLTTSRSGTRLESLTSENKEISSVKTNYRSYVQSTSVLQTRIEVPYLNKLLTLGKNGKIESAYLYIRPIRSSYGVGKPPLPPVLNLYVSSYYGNTIDLLLDRNGAAQTGNLVIDYAQKLDTYYTFDVTTFLQAQLGAGGIDKVSLLLSIPSNGQTTTVQRLVLGDDQNEKHSRIGLEIYYTVYTGDN